MLMKMYSKIKNVYQNTYYSRLKQKTQDFVV